MPLSRQALALLERMRPTDADEGMVLEHDSLVFDSPVGKRAGKGLTDMALLRVVQTLDKGITLHGFRSALSDWGYETTDYADMIIEGSLAHVIGNKTTRAYKRGDQIERRRAFLQQWADWCDKPRSKPKTKGNVVPFFSAAA